MFEVIDKYAREMFEYFCEIRYIRLNCLLIHGSSSLCL